MAGDGPDGVGEPVQGEQGEGRPKRQAKQKQPTGKPQQAKFSAADAKAFPAARLAQIVAALVFSIFGGLVYYNRSIEDFIWAGLAIAALVVVFTIVNSVIKTPTSKFLVYVHVTIIGVLILSFAAGALFLSSRFFHWPLAGTVDSGARVGSGSARQPEGENQTKPVTRQPSEQNELGSNLVMGRMTLRFSPYTKNADADPGTGEVSHEAKDVSEFSKSKPVNLEFMGEAAGNIKFALAASAGSKFTVTDLYIELLEYKDCPLRTECTALEAATVKDEFIVHVDQRYRYYPLVLPQIVSTDVTLDGPEVHFFDVALDTPPYTLFAMKVVAIVRDRVTAKTERLEGPPFGTIWTEHGNSGGCHKIESWFSQAKWQKPASASFADGLTPLAYSLLIHRVDSTRGFPNIDRLPKDKIRTLVKETANAIAGRRLPFNYFPALYELEVAAGNVTAPESVRLSNELRWETPSTESLYGGATPELSRIAAFRDRLDASLKSGTATQPYWRQCKVEEVTESDESPCKGEGANDGFSFPKSTSYRLNCPRTQ